jgi:hypothetical protein
MFNSFKAFQNMKIVQLTVLAGLITSLSSTLAFSQDESTSQGDKTPVTDRQLAVMMFVDYGRSCGYQTMLAQIQVDIVDAELERDRQILKQNEELFRKNAISRTELEIAQLKVVWGEKQLIVAKKSLTATAAQYQAMQKMAEHFAGVEIPRDELYAIFRRGWDAGCDKGPDEVAAMKAWVDYSKKSLERVRELHRQGGEPMSSVLEKEAQLKIAESNYQNREQRLDRCRKVLFPKLEDIKAIER